MGENSTNENDIDIKEMFQNVSFKDGALNIESPTEENIITDERGKKIGDDTEDVPPSPGFSDGSNGESEFVDDNINKNEIEFINPNQNYIELFETYKKLFENLTDDVDIINKKIEKLIKITDHNINEINSAIKATQIYSKLLTKVGIGITGLILVLIIILFIIK